MSWQRKNNSPIPEKYSVHKRDRKENKKKITHTNRKQRARKSVHNRYSDPGEK